MPQSHGLGRGLASLIPQNQKKLEGKTDTANASVGTPVASPFEVRRAPIMAPTSVHPLKDIKNTSIATGKAETTVRLVMPKESAVSPARSVQDDTPPTASPRQSASVDMSEVSSGEVVGSGAALSVPTAKVVPNPHQPRIQFSEEKLLELAQSIKEHGILQPLIVTRVGDNFELIAGERRLQAAKIVGLTEVPVMIREAENQEKFELAIIENIQRHDLNPIEEARAYERLSKEFELSQESIAKKMGRSRSAIANTMRLLQLPVEIQRAVAEDKISEGHAKALLAIENPEKQRALFELIVRQGLTVRQTESKSREISDRPPRKTSSKDPEIEARESTLSEIFGTKVRIAKTGVGGMIRIDYFSDEEFKNIFSKLTGKGRSVGSEE